MTEAKFTKGPWFCEYGVDGYYAVFHNEDQELVGDARANAHLIAAAPDMYEALDMVLQSTEWSCMESETQDAVITAIAKARGEQ